MYSPKIQEEYIPLLYRLAKERKIPMTRLVNTLLHECLKSLEIPVMEEVAGNRSSCKSATGGYKHDINKS